MDLSRFKYRSTFTSVAKVIVPSDEDRFIAKASLSNLGGLLPAGIKPDENPDMLYIAFEGAVAGLANRNGDAITAQTAIAINDSARYKFISTDHDRDKVVGVIIHPGFSRFGSSEPLTMEEAASLQEPFNMAYVGALWKVVAPMLSKYLYKMGDSTDADSLATSWEIAFNTFSVAVGAKNLFDAKIVKADDPAFKGYEAMLRASGGSGKDAAGNPVYRVIDGEALILGYSIVPNPAAEVKGILPLEKSAPVETATISPASEPLSEPTAEPAISEESTPEKPLAEIIPATAPVESAFAPTESLLAAASEKNLSESLIKQKNSGVTHSTLTMEIKSLEQLTSQWGDIRKLESAASVETFVKSIEEGSKVYIDKLNLAENTAAELRKTQEETEKRAKELEASLAAVQKQLSEVQAAAESAAASQKFNERMASFDEKFELDSEDRAFISEDIRAIASDNNAGFEAYAKKMDRLLCAKKKGMKPPFKKGDEKPGDKKNDKEPDGDGDDKMDAKAAFASVTEIEGQTTVPKLNDVVLQDSVNAKMAAAFAGSITINGKTPAQLAADAAAKEAAQ